VKTRCVASRQSGSSCVKDGPPRKTLWTHRPRSRPTSGSTRARPPLAEVAFALAAQDGSPLAGRLELLERAATQVLARRPDADAHDVLWAEAQLAMHG